MKKIIDGKIYNTETAQKIAFATSDYPRGDFKDYSETLYRTKKGAFFLAGEGGPMTRWGKSVGNMSTFGDGIVAMSQAEALEWIEHRGIDIDIIGDYFDIEEA